MQRRLIQSPFCFLGNASIMETRAGPKSDREKWVNFAVDRKKQAISSTSSIVGLSPSTGLYFRAHGKIVRFFRKRR